ncbi:hypothetical protein GCM10026988_10910 [Vibrio panuliri]
MIGCGFAASSGGSEISAATEKALMAMAANINLILSIIDDDIKQN